MVGNAASVTADPTRTSAPSRAPAGALPEALATSVGAAHLPAGGKETSATGRSLPVAPEPLEAADVEQIIRKLNELMSARQRDLKFHVDLASGRTVITVRDAAERVVRQIPAEEMLAAARALEKAGALIDATA